MREVCRWKQRAWRDLRPNLHISNMGAIFSLSLFKLFNSNRVPFPKLRSNPKMCFWAPKDWCRLNKQTLQNTKDFGAPMIHPVLLFLGVTNLRVTEKGVEFKGGSHHGRNRHSRRNRQNHQNRHSRLLALYFAGQPKGGQGAFQNRRNRQNRQNRHEGSPP